MQEYKEKNILNDLNKLYSENSAIEFKRNIIELTPPLFLDDFNQLTIFIIKKEKQIEISTNLVKELEKSIIKKLTNKQEIISNYIKENEGKEIIIDETFRKKIENISTTKSNLIKRYIANKNEFPELKKTLKDVGIDSDSHILKYYVKNESNLIKEIGFYSESIKVYYNNIYHIIIDKLANSTEKVNIFYKNFTKVFNRMTGTDFKEYKTKKYSTSPIYYNQNNVFTIAKDVDGLAKLYLDIKKIKANELQMNNGILYFEEPKTSKSKFNDILEEFKELDLHIKKLERSDENYLENILSEDLKDISSGSSI